MLAPIALSAPHRSANRPGRSGAETSTSSVVERPGIDGWRRW